MTVECSRVVLSLPFMSPRRIPGLRSVLTVPTSTDAQQTAPATPNRIKLVLLVILCALVWAVVVVMLAGIIALRLQAPAEALPDVAPGHGAVTLSGQGPWGQLEYTRVFTEIPDQWVAPYRCSPPRWFFGDTSRARVIDVLRETNVSPEQLMALTREECWAPTAQGLWLKPDVQTVLSLSPVARANIYDRLLRFRENLNQREVFLCSLGLVDEWTRDSGLPEQYVDLFKRLLFRRGGVLVMADTETVLSTLPTVELQRRFIKMASRRESFLAKLLVQEDTDVAAISRYWGLGWRTKDIEPLLNSLRRVPGGSKLDVVHLLPQTPRRLMYTFPDISGFKFESAPDKENCLWTALNFFNSQPDDKFADAGVSRKELGEHYTPVDSPRQLGDLIVLLDGNDSIVHVANYIADDMVFTKNGYNYTQPWILARMDTLLDTYRARNASDAPLRVAFARRNRF